MKLDIVICALLGFLATSSVSEVAAKDESEFNHIVQQVQQTLPVVLEQAVTVAKKIPLRKRDAKILYDRDGKRFKKVIPEDMARRYDEATFNVYHRRLTRGFEIPRQTALGQDQCISDSIFGIILGFAYGLQYNRKVVGECYANIETSLLALNSLIQFFYLVFLPWEWGTLTLAFDEFITVSSALYGNCQMQEIFNQLASMLSYEGFSGLIVRTNMGLQKELPYYYTKGSLTTKSCIRGESYGRMF